MSKLAVVLLIFSVLAVACGSDGDEPQATGTETSQRVEREATVAEEQERVAEQRAQPAVEPQEVAEVVEAAQQQAEDRTEQSRQIEEAQEEIEEEEPVDELPAEIVGVHKGVRSERNVLGEPDAPVEIRYFGDFT